MLSTFLSLLPSLLPIVVALIGLLNKAPTDEYTPVETAHPSADDVDLAARINADIASVWPAENH